MPKKPAPVIETALEIVPQAPLAVFSPEVPLHNLYHRNGMLATAQGACWLVLAGVELLRVRNAAKHGEWEKWVEGNCEYGLTTAKKYIGLAEGVKDKFLRSLKSNRHSSADLKNTLPEFLSLLETPAQSLTVEQQISLLQAVHKLTDGQTIQQLYLDFGITKKPQGSGAKGRTKGSKSDENSEPMTEEEKAVNIWTDLLRNLELEGLTEKSWAHLPDSLRRKLKGLCTDIGRQIPA